MLLSFRAFSLQLNAQSTAMEDKSPSDTLDCAVPIHVLTNVNKTRLSQLSFPAGTFSKPEYLQIPVG